MIQNYKSNHTYKGLYLRPLYVEIMDVRGDIVLMLLIHHGDVQRCVDVIDTFRVIQLPSDKYNEVYCLL